MEEELKLKQFENVIGDTPYENILEEDESTELIKNDQALSISAVCAQVCSSKDLTQDIHCMTPKSVQPGVFGAAGDLVCALCDGTNLSAAYYWIIVWGGIFYGRHLASEGAYYLTSAGPSVKPASGFTSLTASKSATVFSYTLGRVVSGNRIYFYVSGSSSSAYFSNFTATTTSGTVEAVGHAKQYKQAMGRIVGRTGTTLMSPTSLITTASTYFKTFYLIQNTFKFNAINSHYSRRLSGVDLSYYSSSNQFLFSGRTGSFGEISVNYSGSTVGTLIGKRWDCSGTTNVNGTAGVVVLAPPTSPPGRLITSKDIADIHYCYERGIVLSGASGDGVIGYAIPDNILITYNSGGTGGNPNNYFIMFKFDKEEYSSYKSTLPQIGQEMPSYYFVSAATSYPIYGPGVSSASLTPQYYLNQTAGICAVDGTFWRPHGTATYGTVKGYVLDSYGEPIEAEIRLLDATGGSTSTSTYANANGFYIFENIARGYKLLFTALGYQSRTINVDSVPFTVVLSDDSGGGGGDEGGYYFGFQILENGNPVTWTQFQQMNWTYISLWYDETDWWSQEFFILSDVMQSDEYTFCVRTTNEAFADGAIFGMMRRIGSTTYYYENQGAFKYLPAESGEAGAFDSVGVAQLEGSVYHYLDYSDS